MSPADPLPISLVAHTVFCPRRAWLEAAGEAVPSLAVEAGIAAHTRVDRHQDDRHDRRRSVDVASDALGLTGRCDVIGEVDGMLDIVEVKSSPLRRRPIVTRAQVMQLALQRLCLEESGQRVRAQGVYFTTHRKHVAVALSDDDLAVARDYVAQTRAVVESSQAPLPLEDDPRCDRCSHLTICLPDERHPAARITRRVSVSDPNGQVLHLTTPGSRASFRQGRVRVVRADEALGDVPIESVAGVVVHGNIDLSTALIREILWRQVPVVWCSGAGRVVGFATSAKSPNGLPRVRQHVAAALGNIELARELVSSKIANQATQLRRSSRTDVRQQVAQLRSLARGCAEASTVEELYGLEGQASAVYFAAFPGVLVDGTGDGFATAWPGRQGRAATDPVNVALNFCYGILLADMIRAILACGLDPHAGFVHSSTRNKPALALDLMEQFRPVIADSVVLGCINNGELAKSMFTDVLGTVRLRDAGRRCLISGYERRVQTQFRHPTFGYRVSWRRAMEVQARMLLGVLDGTQPQYVGVRTR